MLLRSNESSDKLRANSFQCLDKRWLTEKRHRTTGSDWWTFSTREKKTAHVHKHFTYFHDGFSFFFCSFDFMLFLVVVALFKQFHVSYAFSYIWRVFIHSSNNGNGLIQINSSTAATLWYIFYVDSFFFTFSTILEASDSIKCFCGNLKWTQIKGYDQIWFAYAH